MLTKHYFQYTIEPPIFIDKLINLKELNEDERSSLSSLIDRLGIVRINNKKQKTIMHFFR